nr:MAG TPA: hypothetical protein [Caudoviricetes sp.]
MASCKNSCVTRLRLLDLFPFVTYNCGVVIVSIMW